MVMVVVLILTEAVLVENIMKRMVNTGAKTVLEIGGVLLELELPARGQEISRDLIGRITQAAEDDRMDHKVERESLGEVVVVTEATIGLTRVPPDILNLLEETKEDLETMKVGVIEEDLQRMPEGSLLIEVVGTMEEGVPLGVFTARDVVQDHTPVQGVLTIVTRMARLVGDVICCMQVISIKTRTEV